MNILAHLKLFRMHYIIALCALLFAGTVLVSADILLNKYRNGDGHSKEDILTMVSENKPNRENCQIIFETDMTQFHDDAGNIRKTVYDYEQVCDQMFNIAYADLNLDFCTQAISGSPKDFAHRYLKLEDFSQVQNACIQKFLTITFATGSLFDPENGFKSTIKVNFGLPFYEDLPDPNSQEFLEHRIAAKKRLIELLEVSPKIDITVDDMVLYSQQAQISLHLEPETSYTFKMKEYASKVEGEVMKSTPFLFSTPKFQYFGLRTAQKITLLPDTIPQTMELLSYDSGKTSAEIKICRIANEQYAKIEVFENTKGLQKEKDAFFTQGIDSMETYDCKTKTITFSDTDKQGTHIARKSFDFAAEIGNPARSGLYYVTFAKIPERTNFGKVQTPLFFGMIDSHITMKISKNGEAFFFVNDFQGKALAGQKIRVYSNEFQEKETQYTYENGNYTEKATYFSPLDTNVFISGALLGETDANGILKVQLKDKVAAHFQKTLDSWDYGSDGKWDSFFVTASSDTNLSYVSSKWNGGITPWNFGYSLNSGWWYGEENLDEITLNAWSDAESKFYTHTFTDRKLYLPGEEVFIKSIFRTSADLKSPSGEIFTLKIQNPAGEEILKKEVSVTDFGSMNTSYILSQDAKLGAYNLSLSQGDSIYAFTSFNVEVFQKPKFKNEVMLQVQGLDDELVSIKETKKEITQWGYEREIYAGDFQIDAVFDVAYYSGLPVAGAQYTYKVYKQAYYDTSYWDDCYYGCYWEAEKEFYTEGTGILDAQGKSQISLPIAFESEYDDYKYIVELTVIDSAGDVISGANSIIARLPAKYKTWNPNSGISFTSEKRFYKAGEKLELTGKMDIGKFSTAYEDQFALIIKKKDYFTKYVQDVRGYKRPLTTSNETIEAVLVLNETNFDIHSDGTISTDYTLEETGEYIFEYGRINPALFKIPNGKDGQQQASEILANFAKEKLDKVYLGVQNISYFKDDYQTLDFLMNTCVGGNEQCNYTLISQKIACLVDAPKTQKIYSDEVNLQELCQSIEKDFPLEMTVGIEDILDASGRRYFTLVAYGDQIAQNPIQSDNKITVLSEKISYKLGEKARVLVRLPFSGGKILWTVEKQGVIQSEYIDVPGNIFFKEIEITDDFLPNAYIGVVAINPNMQEIPEYKVGYTEIVVDKTDKKSDIAIVTNKEIYKPREKVTLDISVQNPLKIQDISELTVMVVDDSLISLMGNVDLNILEKIYRKLPFQIQTSLTNIAMLRNYYFSRQGIVGGSGMGNNKGGDSAISSRNIFKNTAYYNGTVKTDANGKARVEFTLPDNLTNFRVMVVSQSKANIFGYAEKMIEVRKDIFVEDRSPLILRAGDKVQIGANVFNSTDETVDLSVSFDIGTELGKNPVKKVSLAAGASSFVAWDFTNIEECNSVRCTLPYSITVTGKNADLSDKIQGNISIVQDPIILQNTLSSQNIEAGIQKDFTLTLPENTNTQKSSYKVTLSNNPFVGIEDTYKTLSQYPYGCVEQLLSSTLPNAILKRFTNLSDDIEVKASDLENNLNLGLTKILKLQNTDGGFKYWENDPVSDKAMTPHVLRTLLEMRDAGVSLDAKILQNAANYLKNTITAEQPTYLRLEALWAYTRYYTGQKDKITGAFGFPNIASAYKAESLSAHDLLSYTYALYYTDKELYKTQIEKNISLLKQLKKTDSDYEYYSPTEDLAHLAILEMKLGKSQAEVTPAIVELYQKNWKSYWYSTKERNAAFLAFVAYMENYGTSYQNKVDLIFANMTETKDMNSQDAILRIEKTLASVLKDQVTPLSIKNINGAATLFATADIEVHPLDPLKVKPYSNGIQVTREIYEVIDDTKLEDECAWDEARGYYCLPATGLKLFSGSTFKKGAMYQIRLKVNFSDTNQRNNLTLEDHLPAGFTILNSRFQTNSIATSQATSDTWAWNYVNLRPETVMANARYSWGNEAEYKYFIRADYAGEYLYPPLAGYLMYEPTVRANTQFRRIVVK